MQLFRKATNQQPQQQQQQQQRSPQSLGDAENYKFANIPDVDIDTHKYAYVPRFDDAKFQRSPNDPKLRSRPDEGGFRDRDLRRGSHRSHNDVTSSEHCIDDDDELYADGHGGDGPPSPNPLVRSNTIATTGSGSSGGKDRDIRLPGPYIRYRIHRPNRLSSLRVIYEDFDPEKHAAAVYGREKFYSHEESSTSAYGYYGSDSKKSPTVERDLSWKKSDSKKGGWAGFVGGGSSKSQAQEVVGGDDQIIPHLPEEAFRCEFNSFHPRKYPLVLKSPERHTLGVARFKPFNVTGVQAEVCLGGDTRSGARFETVGFERRSSRGGSEPGKGWRWMRGPAPDELKGYWKHGSMKLEDEWGQVVAVMLRETAGGGFVGNLIDNREEGMIFVRLDVRGEDLDWVILSSLAVHQAWKRTRRDTAGSFAAGAPRGAPMAY